MLRCRASTASWSRASLMRPWAYPQKSRRKSTASRVWCGRLNSSHPSSSPAKPSRRVRYSGASLRWPTGGHSFLLREPRSGDRWRRGHPNLPRAPEESSGGGLPRVPSARPSVAGETARAGVRGAACEVRRNSVRSSRSRCRPCLASERRPGRCGGPLGEGEGYVRQGFDFGRGVWGAQGAHRKHALGPCLTCWALTSPIRPAAWLQASSDPAANGSLRWLGSKVCSSACSRAAHAAPAAPFPSGDARAWIRPWTQGEPPFPAVLAGSNGDPASAPHDCERAGERGAIDGQNLPERSLGNFSGEGQRLQKSELRGSHAQWPESPVVVLRQHARGPTETRAHAGKNELLQLTHTEIDAYTFSAIQEIVLGPLFILFLLFLVQSCSVQRRPMERRIRGYSWANGRQSARKAFLPHFCTRRSQREVRSAHGWKLTHHLL